MLKKLIVSVAAFGLLTNAVAAAPARAAPPPEVAPASETVWGQQVFGGASAPILIFLLLMGIGVGIALVVDTKDEPSSP